MIDDALLTEPDEFKRLADLDPELYWDRPSDQWPRAADGSLQMGTQPLDLQDLAAIGISSAAGQERA